MDTALAVASRFHYLGLFALLVLGGLGFPFPEDITLMLCGFLVATGAVEALPALAVVYAGMLIADVTLYSLGRRYGRKVVAHRKVRSFLPPERLAALEDRFRRRGVLVIIAGRHVAGLRAQIFIVAGVSGMGLPKFLVADAFSAVITMALMVGIGYKGGQSLQVIIKDITRIEHIAVLAGVLALGGYLIYRYFRARRYGRP